MTMKKVIITFVCLIALNSKAQNVGVNGTGAVPDPSAMLDVAATDKGVLVPRVALTAANIAAPVVAPLTSLLVYNTATAGVSPNNVIPGYYYWDGARWARLYSGTWLNGGSTTAVGKFYINGINLPANTIMTYNIADPNCTTGSAILAVSWAGLLPGTAAQNYNIRIINVQAGAGSFTIQFVNLNAALAFNGLSLSYVAFY
jgi:hypothetical protein